MERNTRSMEHAPKDRLLEVVDFSLPPTDFSTKYIFGNPVTRNNFAAFVADSFRRTRGSGYAHRLLIAYLDRKIHKPPLVKSCMGFLDGKGWYALTYDEQKYLFDSYSNVNHPAKLEIEMIDRFGENLMEEFSSVMSEEFANPEAFDKFPPHQFLLSLKHNVDNHREDIRRLREKNNIAINRTR